MALDFPSSPVNGQVYDNFIYDATKGTWKSVSSGASPNYLVNPTITDAVITATADTPSTIPLTVNGAASQSANLQEWKNSAGINLVEVQQNGDVVFGGTGSVSDTRTLTINSLGYAGININGDTENNPSAETGGAFVKLSQDGDIITGVLSMIQGGNGSGINASQTYTGTAGNSMLLGTFNSSSPLHLGTNSVVRMTIDTSGRITTPYQPAFYAYGSGTFALSGVQQDYFIPFSTAELNRGNNFNTSNSRFTAPVSGVYCFWMQACTTTATSTGPEIYIHKNGTSINNVAIAYDSAFYNTFGGYYIISLNQNDYIQMSVRNNNGTSFTIERGRSRFAGYLMG